MSYWFLLHFVSVGIPWSKFVLLSEHSYRLQMFCPRVAHQEPQQGNHNNSTCYENTFLFDILRVWIII